MSDGGSIIKKWAYEHDACMVCGTIERPHRSGGDVSVATINGVMIDKGRATRCDKLR